ncbi:hypothetical protein X927_03085 [Petrotoga mexicana DSM 14811]|uniref:Uncharacterized protein n=1 Tax=Petrotoga mexicana DSM 14811 TaxID=1122954 RepID=A0A2K1PCL7_9BACT|nr:hypothetical protein X927_03085 [Petrotoga mexicana DSM 14811]
MAKGVVFYFSLDGSGDVAKGIAFYSSLDGCGLG